MIVRMLPGQSGCELRRLRFSFPMLETLSLSRQAVTPARSTPLLDTVSFAAPAGQVTLVIGPPGAGKRVLLEVLCGISPQDQGSILLHGRDLPRQPLQPNEFALILPAETDSLTPALTVRETLTAALLLRVGGLSADAIATQVARLTGLCGLETIAKERVAQLTPVQYRRLLLATSLVSDPILLLTQDLTQNMDAKSERELLALLKVIASDVPGRVVLNVSSSLTQLPAYDSVVVLHEGHICFHGPARAIPHYFTIKALEDLYPRLAMRPAQRWGESWSRHRDSYYAAFKIGSAAAAAASRDSSAADARIRLPDPAAEETDDSPLGADAPADLAAESAASSPLKEGTAAAPLPQASLATQVSLLTKRRWTLLRRTPREWHPHTFLLFGLPLLTLLLIWPNKGFIAPILEGKASSLPTDQLWPAAFTCLMIAFLQTLIVIFYAVRDGAREIARERTQIERERLAGVGPFAVLLSKAAFLGPLILGQTLWLGLFLEIFSGGLPGPLGVRLGLLLLTGIAFLSLCLAVSAYARTAERAHSQCLSLALAQVLLSGALLGLPRVLGSAIHPFVTSYYGWSGILHSLSGLPVHEAAGALVRTAFASPGLAALGLTVHATLGLIVAYTGLRRRPRA